MQKRRNLGLELDAGEIRSSTAASSTGVGIRVIPRWNPESIDVSTEDRADPGAAASTDARPKPRTRLVSRGVLAARRDRA